MRILLLSLMLLGACSSAERTPEPVTLPARVAPAPEAPVVPEAPVAAATERVTPEVRYYLISEA